MLASVLLLMQIAEPAPALSPASTFAAADVASVRYVVRHGDTLSGIAAFLIDPSASDPLARINGLAPRQPLVVGSTLAIPAAWLRSKPIEAEIVAFRGVVRIEGAGEARLGRKLIEGTRILTGQDGGVTLRLPDASIVTLPSMSTIRIVRLRHVALGDVYDRRFVLEAGRSQYDVTPSHRDGSRFEVRTPVSVAAVRGTVFRVSLPDSGGANAEVLRGDVTVAGSTSGIELAEGFGAHSDRNSTGTPIKLLTPPRILGVTHTEAGSETVLLDAVPGADHYRVELAADEAFSDILAENSGPDPAVAIPPTAIGTYYLRATAFDANGLEGLPDLAVYEHPITHSVPVPVN